MIENEQARERVILAAVHMERKNARYEHAGLETEADTRASLEELSALAATAGAEVVSMVLQNREAPDPATYLGKGKLQEIREMAQALDADGIICDDELTPAQMKNLQDALNLRVMDRTLLILDIFAARAMTGEGKIQVELAQLKYRQSRLIGMGNVLSRLGGGIGTRGPGEKKLETDRRLIAERIVSLNRELEEVRRHRELIREGRSRKHRQTAAIVGYTNAGKSTLLNTMTGADVLAEDALFATLDPTTRVLQLPEGTEVLLTDTVGFIHKLPHHLIEAFRSTLEEAVYADVIVHVADAADPRAEQHMRVGYDTLDRLGAGGKPVITLLNKQDVLEQTEAAADSRILRDPRADHVLRISAKTGEGLEQFRTVLEQVLTNGQIRIDRVFPYAEASKVALIRSGGRILLEEYEAEGIHVEALVPARIAGKMHL